MKRKVQAQRKFAQGAYIPPSMSAALPADRRLEPAPAPEHRHVMYNDMSACSLLDVVAFRNIHLHKEPIVILERLQKIQAENPPPQPKVERNNNKAPKQKPSGAIKNMPLRSRKQPHLAVNKTKRLRSRLLRPPSPPLKRVVKRKVRPRVEVSDTEDDKPLKYFASDARIRRLQRLRRGSVVAESTASSILSTIGSRIRRYRRLATVPDADESASKQPPARRAGQGPGRVPRRVGGGRGAPLAGYRAPEPPQGPQLLPAPASMRRPDPEPSTSRFHSSERVEGWLDDAMQAGRDHLHDGFKVPPRPPQPARRKECPPRAECTPECPSERYRTVRDVVEESQHALQNLCDPSGCSCCDRVRKIRLLVNFLKPFQSKRNRTDVYEFRGDEDEHPKLTRFRQKAATTTTKNSLKNETGTEKPLYLDLRCDMVIEIFEKPILTASIVPKSEVDMSNELSLKEHGHLIDQLISNFTDGSDDICTLSELEMNEGPNLNENKQISDRRSSEDSTNNIECISIISSSSSMPEINTEDWSESEASTNNITSIINTNEIKHSIEPTSSNRVIRSPRKTSDITKKLQNQPIAKIMTPSPSDSAQTSKSNTPTLPDSEPTRNKMTPISVPDNEPISRSKAPTLPDSEPLIKSPVPSLPDSEPTLPDSEPLRNSPVLSLPDGKPTRNSNTPSPQAGTSGVQQDETKEQDNDLNDKASSNSENMSGRIAVNGSERSEVAEHSSSNPNDVKVESLERSSSVSSYEIKLIYEESESEAGNVNSRKRKIEPKHANQSTKKGKTTQNMERIEGLRYSAAGKAQNESNVPSTSRKAPESGKKSKEALNKEQSPSTSRQSSDREPPPRSGSHASPPRRPVDTSREAVQAPVFYPTAEEFSDPLSYIEKLMVTAGKYGLCKVVAPAGFEPACTLSDEIRFNVINQYIARLYNRWGPAAREMCAIKACLASQSVLFTRAPLLNGIEVNLAKLYHLVQRNGGLKKVIEKKRWGRVIDEMRYTSGSNPKKRIDQLYFKYLLPYDTLSNQERQEMISAVERGWNKKNQKMLERALNPLHRQKRLLGESESSDDEAEEANIGWALSEAEDCIVSGRAMNLGAFKKVATNLKNAAFGAEAEPDAAAVERQYWQLVLLGQEHVCAYTASIDTGDEGYGFTKHRADPYGRHPWNLKVLSQSSGNVLRSLGPVLGVTAPTLHLGMVFSTSCWHRDPHGLPWIEYMHAGPPKIWYGIPDQQSDKFRRAVETLCPTSCQNKSIWLPSDITMIPPALLREHNVSLARVEQNPGEFIIVFPKGYSCSICTGYTQSESVYFATNSWLRDVSQVFQEVRDSCEPTMFALEQLLIAVALDSRAPLHVMPHVYQSLDTIVRREIELRQQLVGAGLQLSHAEQSRVRNSKKRPRGWNAREQQECEICRTTLYLSKVTGMPDKRSSVCLQHAARLLEAGQARDPTPATLLTFYHDSQLRDIVATLQRRLNV